MPRLHAPETRWFDDFAIGETFYIPSRTMTDALFAAFQLASGDNDPIHYDVEFCKERGHPALLAHGLQVFIQAAAGAGNFPQQTADSLVALLSFSGEMHHPLYAGDTAYPGLEIVKLTPQRTTGIIEMRAIVLNQHAQLIMEGTHRYLVKKIQPVVDESFCRKSAPSSPSQRKPQSQAQSTRQKVNASSRPMRKPVAGLALKAPKCLFQSMAEKRTKAPPRLSTQKLGHQPILPVA